MTILLSCTILGLTHLEHKQQQNRPRIWCVEDCRKRREEQQMTHKREKAKEYSRSEDMVHKYTEAHGKNPYNSTEHQRPKPKVYDMMFVCLSFTRIDSSDRYIVAGDFFFHLSGMMS